MQDTNTTDKQGAAQVAPKTVKLRTNATPRRIVGTASVTPMETIELTEAEARTVEYSRRWHHAQNDEAATRALRAFEEVYFVAMLPAQERHEYTGGIGGDHGKRLLTAANAVHAYALQTGD